MEKKLGNELQKFFLMLLLVIIMAVVAVMYLYLPLLEERDKLIDGNIKLNTRWIELRNMGRDTEIYKESIASSREEISKVLSRYGAGNTPEKSIVLVTRLESEVGMKIPNVSFSTPTTLTSVDVPTIQDAGDNQYNITYSKVNLLTETLTLNYSCTYEQLKKMVDFVNSYPERMNVKSVTVSYDSETGNLSGSLVLNLYAVTGTNKEYTEPLIEDIRLGEENIFTH